MLTADNGWTVVYDQWKGSYAYKGKEWVAFDDKQLLHNKASFVREHSLSGIAVNALTLDDAEDTCGQGKFPMLTEIHSILWFPRRPKCECKHEFSEISVSFDFFPIFCFF